jgi:hypothetical protein
MSLWEFAKLKNENWRYAGNKRVVKKKMMEDRKISDEFGKQEEIVNTKIKDSLNSLVLARNYLIILPWILSQIWN